MSSFIVLVVLICIVLISSALGLTYFNLIILFGAISCLAAPFVIHRLKNPNEAIVSVVLLALFASYPLWKYLKLEGLLEKIVPFVAYFILLWVIGAGWRRSWAQPESKKQEQVGK